MPIRAELKHFYGKEWRTVTRPRILERAGNCCERCKKPNGARVETYSQFPRGFMLERKYQMWYRVPGAFPGGYWIDHTGKPDPSFDTAGAAWAHQFIHGGSYPAARWIRVVLAIAHLNHQAGDDRDENLAALCQWCHLIHDRDNHHQTRGARKDVSRPMLQLPSVN
jgi:hypothetical protein